jgi:hypothetical protein
MDLETEAWAKTPTTRRMQDIGYTSRAIADPVRDRVTGLSIPADTSKKQYALWCYFPARDSLADMNPSGTFKPLARSYDGFAYDSRYDVFLIYGGGAPYMWVYDPKVNSWDTVAVSALPASPDNVYLNMIYDPVHDLCLLQNNGEGWYVFRYVRPGAPVAAFTYAAGISAGQADFDASGSSGNSGAIVKYEWDFNYSWQAFNPSDTGKLSTHAFADSGCHTVALRVTDSRGRTCIYADTTVHTASGTAAETRTGGAVGQDLLRVFPNPFSSGTTFYLGQGRKGCSIEIYSIQGKLVKKIGNISQQQVMWDTRTVSPGMYIIQLRTRDLTVWKSVMLLR